MKRSGLDPQIENRCLKLKETGSQGPPGTPPGMCLGQIERSQVHTQVPWILLSSPIKEVGATSSRSTSKPESAVLIPLLCFLLTARLGELRPQAAAHRPCPRCQHSVYLLCRAEAYIGPMRHLLSGVVGGDSINGPRGTEESFGHNPAWRQGTVWEPSALTCS